MKIIQRNNNNDVLLPTLGDTKDSLLKRTCTIGHPKLASDDNVPNNTFSYEDVHSHHCIHFIVYGAQRTFPYTIDAPFDAQVDYKDFEVMINPALNYATHVHGYLGTVTRENGHIHTFSGFTGPPIPVGGGHIHTFCGVTSEMGRQLYLFTGETSTRVDRGWYVSITESLSL